MTVPSHVRPAFGPRRSNHLSVALGIALVSLACGGPELDRLEGEPAATHKFTQPVSRRTHPAVDGAQRFLAAMQEGNAEAAYRQLTRATRQAMQRRAEPAGVNGVDLLRLRRMPVGDSMRGAVPFDPVALFVVPGVETFQLMPTAEAGDTVEQRLAVAGAGGKSREILMRFEGYAWRIHYPDLKMPETP